MRDIKVMPARLQRFVAHASGKLNKPLRAKAMRLPMGVAAQVKASDYHTKPTLSVYLDEQLAPQEGFEPDVRAEHAVAHEISHFIAEMEGFNYRSQTPWMDHPKGLHPKIKALLERFGIFATTKGFITDFATHLRVNNILKGSGYDVVSERILPDINSEENKGSDAALIAKLKNAFGLDYEEHREIIRCLIPAVYLSMAEYAVFLPAEQKNEFLSSLHPVIQKEIAAFLKYVGLDNIDPFSSSFVSGYTPEAFMGLAKKCFDFVGSEGRMLKADFLDTNSYEESMIRHQILGDNTDVLTTLALAMSANFYHHDMTETKAVITNEIFRLMDDGKHKKTSRHSKLVALAEFYEQKDRSAAVMELLEEVEKIEASGEEFMKMQIAESDELKDMKNFVDSLESLAALPIEMYPHREIKPRIDLLVDELLKLARDRGYTDRADGIGFILGLAESQDKPKLVRLLKTLK